MAQDPQPTALCNLCSNLETSVQVLCEGRCLICLRCERSPAIQKLLRNACFPPAEEDAKPANLCPICENPIARSMLKQIRSSAQAAKLYGTHSGRFIADADMNFFDHENTLSAFLKRFRATYKDVIANENTEMFRPDTAASRRPNSPKEISLMAPSMVSKNEDDANSLSKSVTGKKSDVVNPYYNSNALPPKLTPAMATDFFLDACCAMVTSLQKAAFFDSVSEAILRICNRKKYSQKSNDYRAKAILDFMRGDSCCETAYLYLFGRLLGLQPRRGESRPAFSSICTAILIFGFSEKALRRGTLFDEYGQPSEDDFRKMVRKFAELKMLPVKKALRVVSALSESHQPHWVMSPMIAACVEYSSPAPWEPESMSRLLHLIWYAISPITQSAPVTATNASSVAASASTPSIVNPSSTTLSRQPSGLNTQSFHSSPGQSTPDGQSNSPSHPPSAGGVRSRHSWGTTGISGGGGGGGSAGGVVSSQPAPPLGKQSAAPFGTYVPLNSQHEHLFRIARLKSLSAKAKEFWSASIKRRVVEKPATPSRRKKEIQPNASQLELNYPKNILGQVVNCSLPFLDIPTFLELVSLYGFPSWISIVDLTICCIEAWDAEYLHVRHCLERSLVTRFRRNAIAGSFQTEALPLTPEYRLAVARIIEWYEAQGYKGVDWDEVKSKGMLRTFPFHVPPHILDRSQAELNYTAEIVHEQREYRKSVETLEDLLTLDGPYGHITRRRVPKEYLTQFKNGEEDQILTKDQVEDMIREQYLQGQTLGDGSNEPVKTNRNKVLEDLHRQLATNVEAVRSDGSFVEKERPRSSQKEDEKEKEVEIIDTFPEAITRILGDGNEISSTAEKVSNLRRKLLLPRNFSLPNMPKLEDELVTESLERLKLKPSIEELAKTRIRGRIEKAKRLADLQRPPTPVKPSIQEQEKEDEESVFKAGPSSPFERLSSLENAGPIRQMSAAMARKRSTVASRKNQRNASKQRPEAPFVSDEEMIARNKADGFASTLSLNQAYHSYVDNPGEDMRALAAAVNAIMLRRLKIPLSTLQALVDRYFQPWQLARLRKLELSDTELGRAGVNIFVAKFKQSCALVHLNLCGAKLGDLSCSEFLKACLAGGGGKLLKRLELSDNNLTLATESMVVVSKFSQLRALDLSHNSISLDIPSQQDLLVKMLLPLSLMESLSLAYNRFQDHGFSILCEICANFQRLKMLDVVNCFISRRSCVVITHLLSSSSPKLDVLMMQENLIVSGEQAELRSAAQEAGVILLLDGPYTGIKTPLRYEIVAEENVYIDPMYLGSTQDTSYPWKNIVDQMEAPGAVSSNVRRQNKLKLAPVRATKSNK